jgi:dynein heavy chain
MLSPYRWPNAPALVVSASLACGAAIWIENMNTVLDDNKKLCLMSGEMMAMSSVMSMIFEVQDLAVASPATVSRCGMVYVEPSQIGWEPLLTSWLTTLPTCLDPHLEKLKNLFGWLVPACLRYVNKECKTTLAVGIPATDDITRVNGLMKLMTCLFAELNDEARAAAVTKELPSWVENIFTFSLIWTVAGVIDGASRPKFDTFLRQFATGKPPRGYEKVDGQFGEPTAWAKWLPDTEGATCFEFVFLLTKSNWALWTETIAKDDTKIAPTAEFSQIIVPTLDTARYTFLLETLLRNNKPCLFVGPTGTGKTLYVQKLLLALPAKEWASIFINYSAQTTANQAQDIIDLKLDKRRKGVFGPPMGKRAVIFVDDLNMPALETYGAQPPIEILRQFMDHEGWYDRKENVFRKLVDLSFVCAMGPPGGGRNTITPRYMRHFNIIAYTPFDDSSMQRIFQSIFDWWLAKEGFDMSFMKLSQPIIAATMDIYKASMLSLLPTPSKSHYTFNLRDFARVVQGMLLSSSGDFEKKTDMMLLWAHEVFRVFSDRLTDDDDRLWFIEEMKKLTLKHFEVEMDTLFAEFDMNNSGDVDDDDVRYLMYSQHTDPKAAKKIYRRVKDLDQMQKHMVQYLEDYNQISSKPMKLVLFLFAVEHIMKIARVLSMPRGNALLAGVGGSGRQSVTRLAAHISDMDVFGIEVSKSYSMVDWREDLKTVLRKAGAEGKPTVFLFADTQIKEEAYLEDINGLLNAGEVPNLFANDEKAQICDLLRDVARNEGAEGDGSPTTLFAYFVTRCRALLHIVLAMSPIGDAFRTRLRMFPSLVNCCTIDWFRPWPSDALDAVASTFLAEVEMEKHNRQSTVEMCKIFHESVRMLSEKFRSAERREVYVTPTSYLELIQTFQTLLARKRTEIDKVRKRYDNGLEQLRQAGEAVTIMQQEIIELQPELVVAKKETEEMQVVIDKEVREVIEPKKEIVSKEEAAVGKVAAEAKAMKEDCEADLAEAIPALNAAVSALDTIKKPDIDMVKVCVYLLLNY